MKLDVLAKIMMNVSPGHALMANALKARDQTEPHAALMKTARIISAYILLMAIGASSNF